MNTINDRMCLCEIKSAKWSRGFNMAPANFAGKMRECHPHEQVIKHWWQHFPEGYSPVS